MTLARTLLLRKNIKMKSLVGLCPLLVCSIILEKSTVFLTLGHALLEGLSSTGKRAGWTRLEMGGIVELSLEPTLENHSENKPPGLAF
jgi:hypothetical protein